ncbi:MAG: homoserine dehydrogenase [Acidimicrobiales bacterium]
MARGRDSGRIRVGLLGCGHVGAPLAGLLLTDGDRIAALTGLRLELAAVAVRSRAKQRAVAVPEELLTTDARAVVDNPDVDIVVELIGGIEPARTLLLDALKSGKPVVTGNKELLANFGPELYETAASAGVDILFEAAVAGAVPLIRSLRESLAGERISRVLGIVNGTTNFILSRMTDSSVSYADALAEAQGLGYAESDPSADVDGLDAAAKAAILANVAFGARVVAGDVYREGIREIGPREIEVARRLGYAVKLLAIVEHDPGPPEAVGVRVHPAMVGLNHPLAKVSDSFNAVFVEGAAVGEMMLLGRGAGGLPTASAVLGDLIDAAHNLATGGWGRTVMSRPILIRPIDELISAYALTLEVVDRPGVLHAVSGVLGEHQVSVRSMEQDWSGESARLVFVTHPAREADVQACLHDMRALEAVKRIGGLIRVIESR